jgi:hypothetical protein
VNGLREAVMRSPLHEHRFSALAVSALRKVRARTWLILGAAVVGILGLVTWAGIALLSWLWGQFPVATEAGKRLAGEAVTQIEQVAPGVKEQVGQWVPGLVGESPASDVSGTDVGPVPRFPGLVRSHFARGEKTVEVRYAGRGAFDSVRAHYVQGFAAAGYAQEVTDATLEAEHHSFRAGQESIELSLLRQAGGRMEVRLKVLAQ